MADRHPDDPGAKNPDGTSQDAANAPGAPQSCCVATIAPEWLGNVAPLNALGVVGVSRETRLQPRSGDSGADSPTLPAISLQVALPLPDWGRDRHGINDNHTHGFGRDASR